VDVAALVADDGLELLVLHVIDERRVNEDEGVVVGAVGARVQDGAVDDVDGGHGDAEGLGALDDEAVDARELARSDLDRLAKELVLAERLEHANDSLDCELNGARRIEGETGLAIEGVGVRMFAAVFAAGALSLAVGDPLVEFELADPGHGDSPPCAPTAHD